MMRAELTPRAIAADAGVSDFIDLSATPWRRIMLSARGDWCLVDAIDFEWLSQWTWNVSWGSRTPWQFYAKRNVGRDRATLRMHREIMIFADPREEKFMAAHPVDHGNGQTLDNRRANLAWVTQAQNQANKRPRATIPSLDAIVLQLLAEHGYAQPQEVPF
jgi:hypothetical protein